jgi:6,7-dimethyl-8-ribityllumazine synthase
MVRLGLVVASFADEVVEQMADRARRTATERGASIVTEREVPGVYDTPLAADRLARREDVNAVAVVGAVISGDTDHDQVITRAAATGCTDVSLDRDTPVTFGVTGPGMSGAEARERLEYGSRAVDAAIDLVEGS